MTYHLADDLSERTIGDEIFVLKRGSSTIHSFNATGTMIWKLFRQKAGIDEISRQLSSKFEIDENEALEDVSEFLSVLVDNKMVIIDEHG
jgi:hypothetical protein